MTFFDQWGKIIDNSCGLPIKSLVMEFELSLEYECLNGLRPVLHPSIVSLKFAPFLVCPRTANYEILCSLDLSLVTLTSSSSQKLLRICLIRFRLCSVLCIKIKKVRGIWSEASHSDSKPEGC